jgi:hypothetical protein
MREGGRPVGARRLRGKSGCAARRGSRLLTGESRRTRRGRSAQRTASLSAAKSRSGKMPRESCASSGGRPRGSARRGGGGESRTPLAYDATRRASGHWRQPTENSCPRQKEVDDAAQHAREMRDTALFATRDAEDFGPNMATGRCPVASIVSLSPGLRLRPRAVNRLPPCPCERAKFLRDSRRPRCRGPLLHFRALSVSTALAAH